MSALGRLVRIECRCISDGDDVGGTALAQVLEACALMARSDYGRLIQKEGWL